MELRNSFGGAQDVTWLRARMLGWIMGGMMSVLGAACGHGGTSTPTAPAPVEASPFVITSLTVTSAGNSGPTIQLTAVAGLFVGGTVDVTQNAAWDSSNANIATVAPGGMVTVLAGGNVTVRATYGGVSASIDLAVSRPLVVSLTITGGSSPATSFQLTATAHLADGSTLDVTNLSTWVSSDPTNATVSSVGFVTVTGKGTIEFRATYQGISGVTDLAVSIQTP
jgi:hypothetical protein